MTLVPTGEQIEVEPGECILDAALRAGLNLPHSCKAGRCGSCRARILSGCVTYPAGRPLALTEAEERAGFALLCQARVQGPVAIETRQIQNVTDVQIRSLPCRVQRMQRLAPDVMGLWLRLPAVEPFAWQPGQYIDVMLSGGRRRSFSLANPPHDGALLELHVRRSSRGEFTTQVFESMTEGTLLRIEGPLGQMIYRPQEGPLLLVGGGTGYAPLKAILRHVLESGAGREVTLFWGARTASDLYEDGWLRELAGREPDFRYVPVLSDEDPAAGGLRGLVHEAVLAAGLPLARADIYLAGPPEMVAALREALPRHGA
ncbi:MAG: 2Fe-2S iron-sulfur cluster-binding protein, partial [Chloroflexi bacterium]|nr:2Fe-2S iron-sulfur cluster-binding protein [Chloroflexota bacterium]